MASHSLLSLMRFYSIIISNTNKRLINFRASYHVFSFCIHSFKSLF
ncbi:hypothetical protein HMPREF1411_01346 [Helicobacter pylori GAM250AFi]|nr:hypothetical protein HMPREF1411_01346 [Helicobacter pylori GAM250AFi]EMH15717.1 hypothetical protein HMPREF1414_00448 [Helicobacter pylori GAM252T]EMH51117.1 hypothetical protein HMPREF1440_01015 [Helicobacter pylori HP250AFiV]EMH55086.1 hypothetical protein HMPREF1442_00102 [Helicobacter pylori HP250ASii]EMH62702.1 hypothetical protein HMPREF1447_00823 [Helicobacter pylori HP250BSi]